MFRGLMCTFILLILLLTSGCQGISEGDAKQTALLFVHDKVKFYSREGNTTVDQPDYNMEVVDSYKEGNNWVFLVGVSSTLGDETKTATMKVVVDGRTNQVLDFKPNII